MLIALDYDDTFTSDTQCWREVIEVLKKHGHEVFIATSRFNTLENRREIKESTGLEALFCAHNAKAETARGQYINPDIWIDDDPWAIVGVDKS
jgi:hydroxymethylpyrimidine pyrophosphatase-like HAD family hydrolase